MTAGNCAFRDQKVYLHPVILALSRRVGVEKQLAAIGNEHLRHDIFHQHPGIDFQLVFENLLVKLFGDDSPFVKSMTLP